MQLQETSVAGFVTRQWRTSPPLTAAGLFMIPLLAAALAGVWLDPRVITGAPAWLKPAKFATSIAVYTLTLAWVFTYLPAWARTRRIVGWTTAVVLVGEIVIIALQAWRGTSSHFNVGTPLDRTLFMLMGVGILVQTLASVAVAVALWRQRFEDRALGVALRLGMTLTIIGASAGSLMTRPTEAQLAAARSAPMTLAGAHTVGAPDGGPGLPGTGWSITHGDMRVPHFLGLHALQALPLLVLAFPRRWHDTRRAGLAVTAAASYAGLFGILLWQALRGESLISPGEMTLAAVALWAIATAGGTWLAVRVQRPRTRQRPSADAAACAAGSGLTGRDPAAGPRSRASSSAATRPRPHPPPPVLPEQTV